MNIFDCAIKMEEDARGHYEMLAKATTVPELKNIFTLLAGAEKEHYETLKKMRERVDPASAQFASLNDAACHAIEIAIGELFYGSEPQLFENRIHRSLQWTIERTPTGAVVSAATETLGDGRHIHFALAAQTDAIAPIGHLAEEHRDLDVLYRQRVIHQPFAVFIFRAEPLHLFVSYRDPSERPLALQVR